MKSSPTLVPPPDAFSTCACTVLSSFLQRQLASAGTVANTTGISTTQVIHLDTAANGDWDRMKEQSMCSFVLG